MDTKILLSALMSMINAGPIYYPDGRSPKARVSGGHRNKTKKGAKHKVKPSFKPRNILKVTGAAYRRQHKGKVTIKPNYLKDHPAPLGRNVAGGL